MALCSALALGTGCARGEQAEADQHGACAKVAKAYHNLITKAAKPEENELQTGERILAGIARAPMSDPEWRRRLDETVPVNLMEELARTIVKAGGSERAGACLRQSGVR